MDFAQWWDVRKGEVLNVFEVLLHVYVVCRIALRGSDTMRMRVRVLRLQRRVCRAASMMATAIARLEVQVGV